MFTSAVSPLFIQLLKNPRPASTTVLRHKQSFHEIIFAMIRKDQVARIPANDMETQRILIASLFAIAF
jgi:hypothetical protein